MEKIKKALEFASRNRLELGNAAIPQQPREDATLAPAAPSLPPTIAETAAATEHAVAPQPEPSPEPQPAPELADLARAAPPGPATPVPSSSDLVPGGIEFTETRVERVPYSTLTANKVILPHDDESDPSRAYQILSSQLIAKVRDTGFNSIAVVSPGPEEGKSLTAINLAISITRRIERTALVVDLDFRRPSTARYLGLEPQRGVEHVLRDECRVSEAMVSPGISRLTVLPIANADSASAALLDTGACRALAHELKHRYANRIVLFDLPPLLAYGDALSFLPLVDAALLVVTEGVTKRGAIEHSLQILSGTQLLGTVLNQSAEKQAGYG